MKTPCLWMLAILWMLPVAAQVKGAQPQPASGPAKLVFHFERAGLAVPVYTVTLYDSGEGAYQAGDAGVSTPLRLTKASYKQIFDQIRTPNAFRGCNSRVHNLANTGIKTLAYTDANASQTCTYNYSDSKIVTALTDTFENMEYVLEAGQRLEHEHRFDRLGLDQEMRSLMEAAQAGRTAGLANIAPVLKSIIDDPLVLERVRASAMQLMEQGSLGK